MVKLCHLELRDANAFVEANHRHHKRIQGHRFSLGAMVKDRLVGVIIIGRPVGGTHQTDWTEVTRCCVDGTRNACSFLYGAAARASTDLGFIRIQTYILDGETGVSLKASGWRFDRLSHPVGWHHHGGDDGAPGRYGRQVEAHLQPRKQLWYRDLGVGKNCIYEHSEPKNPREELNDLISMMRAAE